MQIIAALIMWGFGSWGLWYSVHELERYHSLRQHGARTEGVVTAVQEGEGGGRYEVRFVTVRQEDIRVWLSVDTPYREGAVVSLLYDSANPRKVFILEPLRVSLSILRCVMSFAVIVAGGLVLMIW